mgnify:CR=1 FL=1
MKTALIVVDVQNDFCQDGTLAVPSANDIVPIVNSLMHDVLTFDVVVATQDLHPKDHGSFAKSKEELFSMKELSGLPQVMWPAHCVEGTKGADFHKGINPELFDKVFPKGTDKNIDSYSGFFDNGKKKSTGMGEWLKEQGVTHVYVVGLALDYCVKATAVDAKAFGFETVVIERATKAVNMNPNDGQAALKEMQEKGIIIE